MDLSEYDDLLAQRLLKDRGEELDEDKIKILQNKRIKDISRPNTGSVFMIPIGYF